MGLRITNRVYTDSEGRTGTSMQGNYLDASIVKYEVEYDATFKLSTYTQVIKKGNVLTLLSGTWEDVINAFNGANIIFSLENQTNPRVVTTTIDYVNGAQMALVDAGSWDDGVKSVGYFTISDVPALFELDFNLLQNSQGNNRYSLIDGETNRFSVELVNALIVAGSDNFIQLGKKSGGSEITARITREVNTAAGNQVYSIVINYKNWLVFDSDRYKADDCIGDYVRIRTTAEIGNRNAFIEVESKNVGNTGYEDEIFNGGANPYTHSTIVWTDGSGNVMDAMDYSQASTFNMSVVGSALDANYKYGLKLFRLPQDEAEYKNTSLNLERNLSLCMNSTLVAESVPTAIAGEVNSSSAAFDVSAFEVVLGVGSATVTGVVTPNLQMTTLLDSVTESNRRYKLVLVLDDTSKTYKADNAVNLLIDDSDAIKNTIPLGTWSATTDFDMIDADGNILATPVLMLESNNRINATFTLPKNASFVNPWNSLTGRIVAERISNKDRFNLEEFVYDISELSATVPTKVLGIEYLENRGKQLPTGSQYNEVEFSLYPTLDDLNNFGVQLNYGFRVGFEDWIELPDADNYFQGSKTNNWYTYASDADWQLKFELVLSSVDGDYTNYIDFDVSTYNNVDTWTYTDLDLVALSKPYAERVTIVTVSHTASGTLLGDEMGVVSARHKTNGTQWEISTIEDPVIDGNPLVPTTGETRLKMTVAGANMTFVYHLDPSNIDVTEYTFTLQTKGTV